MFVILTLRGLVFLVWGFKDSYVFGLIFSRLGVSNSYFWQLVVLLFRVCNSYVKGLVFLRLGVSNSYV